MFETEKASRIRSNAEREKKRSYKFPNAFNPSRAKASVATKWHFFSLSLSPIQKVPLYKSIEMRIYRVRLCPISCRKNRIRNSGGGKSLPPRAKGENGKGYRKKYPGKKKDFFMDLILFHLSMHSEKS